MKKLFILLCLVAVVLSAPPNRKPKTKYVNTNHRHLAPARSNYKYLPTLEDADEPAVLGRREKVNAREGSTLVPGPVVEPPKETSQGGQPVATQRKPVGPPENAGNPVKHHPQRRPPPKEEEAEEEEDDESEETDDESEEGDDENEDGDDGNEEDEDEGDEERKRQEKVPDHPENVVNEKSPVQNPPQVKTQSEPMPVSVESSVEDVQAIPSVASNEVVSPEGGSSGNLDDGIEALVPGYITEHGEVLVPVDTVSSDQHISIVPDLYPRQRRLQAHHQAFRSNPIFYEVEGDEGYFDY